MTDNPNAKKTAAALCVTGLGASADYNLVESILPPAVERTAYVVAGLSGLSFVMPQLIPSFFYKG